MHRADSQRRRAKSASPFGTPWVGLPTVTPMPSTPLRRCSRKAPRPFRLTATSYFFCSCTALSVGWYGRVDVREDSADSTEGESFCSVNANSGAGRGEGLQTLPHRGDDVAWRPTQRTENATAGSIKHADFPDLIVESRHLIGSLVVPDDVACSGNHLLVLGRNLLRVKRPNFVRKIQHDLRSGKHGVSSQHGDGLHQGFPDGPRTQRCKRLMQFSDN